MQWSAVSDSFYEILDNIKSKIISADIIYKNTGVKCGKINFISILLCR